MHGARGWTTDPTELLRWQLLAWIADRADDEPDTSSILAVCHVTEADLVATVRAMTADGLVRKPGRLSDGPTSAQMTPEGHAELLRIRAVHGRRAFRAVAAQGAFLDWLYDYGHDTDPSHMPIPDSFAGDVRAHYGDPFAVPEIKRRGLPRGTGDVNGRRRGETPDLCGFGCPTKGGR